MWLILWIITGAIGAVCCTRIYFSNKEEITERDLIITILAVLAGPMTFAWILIDVITDQTIGSKKE